MSNAHFLAQVFSQPTFSAAEQATILSLMFTMLPGLIVPTVLLGHLLALKRLGALNRG